jgi:hypothetical protein
VRRGRGSSHELEVFEGDRGLGESDVVARGLERGEGGRGLLDRGRDLGLARRAVDAVGEELDRRASCVALRPDGAGPLDRVGEERFGLMRTSGLRERDTEVRQDVEPT